MPIKRLNAKKWTWHHTEYKCCCGVFVTSRSRQRKHRFCEQTQRTQENLGASSPATSPVTSSLDFDENLVASSPATSPITPSLDFENESNHNLMPLLMYAGETHTVQAEAVVPPPSKLEDFSEEINSDLLNLVIQMKYKLMLKENVSEEILSFIKDLLRKCFARFVDPLKVDPLMKLVYVNLESSYLRQKLISQYLPVQPKHVGKFTYLPISTQVKFMMEESEKFRSMFKKEAIIRPVSEIMRSPLDGMKVSNALRNVKTEYIVPLVIYFDEFCDVCSIGAFTKRNKLSVFEWRVVSGGNTDNNCFLLSFANSSSITTCKTVELNKVLKEIAEETSQVLSFSINGQLSTCTLVPIFVAADNLAAHQMLGMFESFSANMPCGKCMLPKSLFAHIRHENELGVKLRTADGTINQLSKISNAKSLQEREEL